MKTMLLVTVTFLNQWIGESIKKFLRIEVENNF